VVKEGLEAVDLMDRSSPKKTKGNIKKRRDTEGRVANGGLINLKEKRSERWVGRGDKKKEKTEETSRDQRRTRQRLALGQEEETTGRALPVGDSRIGLSVWEGSVGME